jgi:hypothetical protein
MFGKYKFWDPEDQKVLQFFAEFPIKNQTDSEIVECDFDLLFTSIHYFSDLQNINDFVRTYTEKAKNRTWITEDYRDKVSIPHFFFKGYFHPWAGECLSGIRIGNPKDPMYKYSYETPSTRTYAIVDAFNRAAIPCPKCFEDELVEIFQSHLDNFN